MEDNKEITFEANCQICGTKNVSCRNHHLVPQRLLKQLPFNKVKRWEHLKVIACDNCNRFFHPEAHLYKKIIYLENKIKELEQKLKQ
jgi:transcription elongation factor Elf1